MVNFKAQNRRLAPRFHYKESCTTLKSVICSFEVCFQNYGQLKSKFLRQKNTSSTFLKFELSSLSGPMLKTRKNAKRNQFEQQWFDVISFQKPRRVYPAIWYNLKPFAPKKGRFTLSTPASARVTFNNAITTFLRPGIEFTEQNNAYECMFHTLARVS